MRIKRLHPNAVVPRRATEGAAGYDLSAVEDGILAPGERCLVPTGWSFELFWGTEGNIRPRSVMGKRSLDVIDGTIDADYRGEVSVCLQNNSLAWQAWKEGDRIAQMVVSTCLLHEPVEVEELTSTARGTGGFGSTGA